MQKDREDGHFEVKEHEGCIVALKSHSEISFVPYSIGDQTLELL